METDYNHPGEWASRAGQVKYDASPAGSSLLPGSPGDRSCGVALWERAPGIGTAGRAAAHLSVKLLRKVFEMETFHVSFGLLIREVPFNSQ